MNKIPSILSLGALAAAAVLAACASSPIVPQELVSARAAVRSAESDPQVLNYASLELKRATDALNRANQASIKGETLAEISSAAYVAERRAQVAMAIAKSKSNEESMKSAEADRERARADARTAEAQRANVRAAAARADASSARAQASQASQQAAQATQQAAQANQQAAQAQAATASIGQQNAMLQQQLAELQAKSTDRGMLVTLGDVLFEFGRAEIKPSAQGAMQKLATYLQEHPERRVLVEGYTDSVGSDSANQQLSQRRADAVATALARLGVSGARINTMGYGEEFPIANNTSDTNRALNRRVEVYISDSDQPVRSRS